MTFQYITLPDHLSFQLLHKEISLYGPLQKISAPLQKMSFSFFKLMQTSRFLSLMRNMLSMYIRSKFLFKKANLVQKKEVNLLLLVTCQISKMTKQPQVDTNLGQQRGPFRSLTFCDSVIRALSKLTYQLWTRQTDCTTSLSDGKKTTITYW